METKQKITKETTSTPPRWVPKPPPPPGLWDRFRFFLRRSLFPITALIFAVGLIYFILWLPGLGVPSPGSFLQQEEGQDGQVTSSAGSADQQSGVASPPAETVPLSISSEPVGARVLMDGEEIGTTPLQDHAVERGAYILSLQLENYRMPDTLVVLRSGATSSFSFRMRPVAPLDQSTASVEEETTAQQEPPVQDPPAQEPEPVQPTPAEEQEPPPAEAEPQPLETEQEVVEEVDDLEDEMAEEDFAMGSVVVSSDPRGATVLLNGVRRGTTPITLSDLQVGPKEITVRMEGHQTHVEEVEVLPEQMHTVFAMLTPLSGSLRVLARPWGSIYINGELHEAETNVRYSTQLPVGTHTVRVDHPTLGSQERQVTIREGEVTSIVIDLNQ